MTIIQNAKAFLFKKGFDFDKPDITLQLFHPQLQVFFAVNGIFFNNRESKIRDTFLKGQLLIWQLCWCWLSFPIFIATLYISNTLVYLLYQSTIATQDEHMVRPFMFPLWLPADDPHRTPNYEIFFLLEVILIFVVLCTFVLYVYILFHLLLHYYNLMDIILIAFGELFDDLDESVATRPPEDPRRQEVQAKLNRRMGQIARWHHSVFESVETISSVYGPALVYQTMFSSVVICLIAFQVAEQLSEGKFDYLFGVLGVGACMQLWIPCYIGTLLRNKGFSLGDRCFYSGWHGTQLGRLLRRDFVIFIQRSQEPLAIKFTALPHLQLETFSSIMSSAYSYFNMLRQYN
ncbi:odorant receptor Or2-like isoform X2 [Choristoneura fumiferana]|uniref:odorant receptor Or2-like isoform X2 n=1 Tax=Choristoneura fumiferana TaxID=7141 RepID=UPI003D157EBD